MKNTFLRRLHSEIVCKPTSQGLGIFIKHLFYRSFRTSIGGCFCSNKNKQTSFVTESVKAKLKHVPSFGSFMMRNETSRVPHIMDLEDRVPYLENVNLHGQGKTVFFDVHGCQMNINDTEIAWSILQSNGYSRAFTAEQADIVLVMTCAIREGAEGKIWSKLRYLAKLKQIKGKGMKIGVIGCMAERLKNEIIEKEKVVDIVCGPDAYRDLPRMLAVTYSGNQSVNVLLSLEETYADIMPVRLNEDSCTAYVSVHMVSTSHDKSLEFHWLSTQSITRGCDNMCSYCIVPFTRGRERSRPIASIVEEVQRLSDQGIKEVTLLGQNVNSYRDTSDASSINDYKQDDTPTKLSHGFKTIYRPKKGGRRFGDLLDQVSEVDPEMRIRFTSPHPKDFPDEVLYLIRDKPNICRSIHLPAQSGSNSVLHSMRRGYTREAYLDLVHHIKSIIPDVSLTSDFIAGFCGETHQDYIDTISLIKQVKYNYAYCFPYSMRKKTHAYHKLKDDVPENIKNERQLEMKHIARDLMLELNKAQVGQVQMVLIEGDSKRSSEALSGRNDGNTKVIIPKLSIPVEAGSTFTRDMFPTDYVMVQITDASSQVLHGTPLHHTTLQKSPAVYRQDATQIKQAIH